MREWSKQYRDVWAERAGDPRLSGWMRVAALAMGMHKANGHAQFRPGSRAYAGDLAFILATVNTTTGEITPAPAERIRRAIDSAVEYGWLAPGSQPACLIVPAHAVEFNVGNAQARCPVNHLKADAKHHAQAVAA